MVATRVTRMDVTPQGADFIVDLRLYFLDQPKYRVLVAGF